MEATEPVADSGPPGRFTETAFAFPLSNHLPRR